VTADVIKKIATASGVSVSDFWPSFYEKALKTNSLDSIISNVGAGGGAAPASGGPAAVSGAPAPAAPEPEPESSSESEEEMDGFALFG
jgi:ribosomal protein L12E/L44/L45/RPP1/RPP2